jgi:TPR repeat protein
MNPFHVSDLPAQLQLAKSSDTPPETLAALAESPSFQVQRHVGQNPRTPVEALTRLFLRTQLRLAIAGDTPPETLAALAGNPDEQVRYQAGKNPHTPIEALTRLSTDREPCENGWVFAAVLKNPRTPLELLARFVEHREASVRRLLASNSNIPSEWLSRLVGDKDAKVRYAVAENPGTPLATLMRFVDDEDSCLRACVAAHPQTPGDILAVLAEDSEESVRQTAFATLGRRTLRRPAAWRESAAERDFAQAVRSFKLAEHDLALKLAQKAARNGSARAQYFLGILYEHGFSRGLAREPERKREKRLAAYRRRKAADSGYEKPEAPTHPSYEEQWFLAAEMYVNPDSPRRDDYKAAKCYRQAADGNPDHRDRYGRSCAVLAMKFLLELYDAGRGIAADTDLWLMERAARGDRRAMPALARLFRKDHRVSGEQKLAIRWLKKALRKGFNKIYAAGFELGLRYLEGRGIERDDAQAARWLARAADSHEGAQFMMGHLYREGRGVERNAAEAVRCYRKAFAISERELHELADLEYLDNRRRPANSKVWAATHAFLREEAEGGNVDACYVLCISCFHGIGIEQNDERAVFWAKKGALAGDEDAQDILGAFAERGDGMAKNPKAALYWHEKAKEKNFFHFHSCGNPSARQIALLRSAADRGNMLAQYVFGLACCSGNGVKQDYAQAASWFQRASVNPGPSPLLDNEPGWPQSELALLYREGKGVERDPALAVHWHETSWHDMNGCSRLALAMAYECGDGVEADLEKARHLYSCVFEHFILDIFSLSARTAVRAQYEHDCLGLIRKGTRELAAFFLELMDDAAAGAV